jgi:hypothetical protein
MRFKLKDAFWPPWRDLQTFRLWRFFTFTGFVVIAVFTAILVLLLTHRVQQMALKKNQEYILLLASNLNHQVYQQFVLPTAWEKGGRITLSDPEQYQRLDVVMRTTIHGFHVGELNQYDQEGVFVYSSAGLPRGKKCDDIPGVKAALAGQTYFELPTYIPLWCIIWPNSSSHLLKAYIPFRLEEKPAPHEGPVVGVFEVIKNISGDLAEIGRYQFIILSILVVIMGLLFLVLRQVVKQAEAILERRKQE